MCRFQYARWLNPVAMTLPPVYAPASATICNAMRRLTACPTFATTATKNTMTQRSVMTMAVDCPRSDRQRSESAKVIGVVPFLVEVVRPLARHGRDDLDASSRNVVEHRHAERHAHPHLQSLPVQARGWREAVAAVH